MGYLWCLISIAEHMLASCSLQLQMPINRVHPGSSYLTPQPKLLRLWTSLPQLLIPLQPYFSSNHFFCLTLLAPSLLPLSLGLLTLTPLQASVALWFAFHGPVSLLAMFSVGLCPSAVDSYSPLYLQQKLFPQTFLEIVMSSVYTLLSLSLLLLSMT